jgi:hypothetical protein
MIICAGTESRLESVDYTGILAPSDASEEGAAMTDEEHITSLKQDLVMVGAELVASALLGLEVVRSVNHDGIGQKSHSSPAVMDVPADRGHCTKVL